MKAHCIALIAFALSCAVGNCSELPQGAQAAIVVSMARSRGALQYSVNATQVQSDRLLDAFAPFVKGDGRNQPVVIMAEGNVTLDDVYSLRGIVQKAGFTRARFYVYSAETMKAVELGLEHIAQPIADLAAEWKPR